MIKYIIQYYCNINILFQKCKQTVPSRRAIDKLQRTKNLFDSVTIHVYKSSLENSLNPHCMNNFMCVYYVYI